MEEIVDIVDEHGVALRAETKAHAHKHGLLHKTVIGYMRKGDTWTLVEQASDRQDAGQLVAPVGGHVMSGESDIEALLRESEEEIGTRNISHTFLGSAIFRRQILGRDENHLFIVYEICTDNKIVLGDEGVSLESFTGVSLKRALVELPERFGDGFYFVLEKFYPDYLPDKYRHRWSA